MSEENKTLVRRYYDEVLNQGQLALFDELAAPDFASHLSGGESISLQIYKQAIAGTLAAMRELHVTIQDQVAEGDKVVTRWTARGIPQVEFAGVKPTGAAIQISAIHIHRVRDGRLVEHWEAINLHAVKRE